MGRWTFRDETSSIALSTYIIPPLKLLGLVTRSSCADAKPPKDAQPQLPLCHKPGWDGPRQNQGRCCFIWKLPYPGKPCSFPDSNNRTGCHLYGTLTPACYTRWPPESNTRVQYQSPIPESNTCPIPGQVPWQWVNLLPGGRPWLLGLLSARMWWAGCQLMSYIRTSKREVRGNISVRARISAKNEI